MNDPLRRGATRASSASPALARDRRRRLHRLAPARGAARARPDASSGSTTSRPATARNLDEVRARVGRRSAWRASGSSRATSRDLRVPRAPAPASTSCCIRLRSARCRARSPIRSTTHARQRRRAPRHARGRARCGRQALRLRLEQLGLRRQPGLPKVEERARPAALALRRHQARQRALRRCLRALHGLQTVGLRYFNVFGPRQDPDGAYAAVIPQLGRRDDRGRAGRDQRRRRDEPRLLLRRERRAGQPARRAVASRTRSTRPTTSPPASARRSPSCSSCCATGSWRGTSTSRPAAGPRSVSRRRRAALARRHRRRRVALLGYEPTHTIERGLDESLAWYEQNLA